MYFFANTIRCPPYALWRGKNMIFNSFLFLFFHFYRKHKKKTQCFSNKKKGDVLGELAVLRRREGWKGTTILPDMVIFLGGNYLSWPKDISHTMCYVFFLNGIHNLLPVMHNGILYPFVSYKKKKKISNNYFCSIMILVIFNLSFKLKVVMTTELI